MVASTHDFHRCDRGDGFICHICEFRARLHALICRAGDGNEEEWNKCVGALADQMFDAIHALHRVRRERFTDAHDEIGNAWEVATRVVEIDQSLRRLRRRVMTDATLGEL